MGRLCSIEIVWLCAAACSGCGPDPLVREDRVQVRIAAHDASWTASYLLEGEDGGLQAAVPSGREVHVPLGAEVALELQSRDFICLFAAPQLGLRDFAAPGLPGTLRFQAKRKGSFELRGDELCGLPHTDKTRGHVVVEDPAAFRAWLRARRETTR